MIPQTSRSRSILGMRIAAPALALAAAMLLSGCSGDDGKKAGEAEETPLQKYFAAIAGEDEYTQEKFDEEMAKTEELVAQCMTKEGFEYIPNSSGGGVVISNTTEEDGDSGPEWGSIEFAKQYGYGIIDWPGMDEADAEEPDDGTDYTDPNEEYINSLSESEQQAFYDTLYGQGPDESEMNEDGSYEYNWETAGCQGWAENQVREDSGGILAAYEDPEFADLFEGMNNLSMQFYDAEQASPEMQAINTSWNACMTKSGISEFDNPNQPYDTLIEEYNELMPEDGDMSKADKSAVDAFKSREIETAVADATCKKNIKYDEQILKLSNAAEQEFVDENKAQLDALVAKYGAKKN